MILLLTAIGLLSFAVAIHPFTTYPLSLLLLRRVGRKHPAAQNLDPAEPLRCAICVCAYNEERAIEAKIRNLLALRARHPDLELLVYVDAATDRTAEILRAYTDRIDVHFSTERRGKTYGMNLLAAKATAPILIFSDANVTMDLHCVAQLQDHFRDPEIGCVCGNLIYTNNAESVTASSGSLYWKLEEALKRLEVESGSMMGADGSIFAVRRSLRLPPPDHIIDDMYVSLMVLVQGSRVVQASNARAFEESVPSGGEEFKRKIRIACQAFNVHRLIWPHMRRLDALNVYKYISHKLIRWFTIYFLALSAVALDAALWFAGHPALAAAMPALAVVICGLGWFGAARPFVQLIDVLAAFTGTGWGVWRSLRGERYQTWTPAASIRR
ncbi:MAG: glycosyltransferase [Proteobacteria bacterium]|nr:glycosyltransferase [Pseudomonadota bacterium]